MWLFYQNLLNSWHFLIKTHGIFSWLLLNKLMTKNRGFFLLIKAMNFSHKFNKLKNHVKRKSHEIYKKATFLALLCGIDLLDKLMTNLWLLLSKFMNSVGR